MLCYAGTMSKEPELIRVVVSGKTRLETYLVVRDMAYVDEDCSIKILKAGTKLTVPVPDEDEPLNVAYVEAQE